MFVDGDGFIFPYACAELYKTAENTNADIVIGKARTARESASMQRFEAIAERAFEVNVAYTGREYLEGCLSGGALRVEVWCGLYRKDFMEQNDLIFKAGVAHEDEEFTPRALLAANIAYNMTHYKPEFYAISSKNMADKMRIVFISDLHLREYGQNNEILLGDIQSLKPDLIILGGDMIIDSQPSYEGAISFCSALARIAPTYGILGNHEDVKMYIQRDSALKARFDVTGIRFLINEIETVRIKRNTVTICGIDGNSSNFEHYGARSAMERLNEVSDVLKICVAHVPAYFSQKLGEYDFDIGFAGHTHGGVIRLPKIGALYSREEGFLPKYADGIHRLKNGGELIISRGMGESGIIPRINNVPELSVIDVN